MKKGGNRGHLGEGHQLYSEQNQWELLPKTKEVQKRSTITGIHKLVWVYYYIQTENLQQKRK